MANNKDNIDTLARELVTLLQDPRNRQGLEPNQNQSILDPNGESLLDRVRDFLNQSISGTRAADSNNDTPRDPDDYDATIPHRGNDDSWESMTRRQEAEFQEMFQRHQKEREEFGQHRARTEGNEENRQPDRDHDYFERERERGDDHAARERSRHESELEKDERELEKEREKDRRELEKEREKDQREFEKDREKRNQGRGRG